MLVRFHRSGDEPGKPRGELITVARDLAELYPDEWRELLAEAVRPRARAGRQRRGRRRSRR